MQRSTHPFVASCQRLARLVAPEVRFLRARWYELSGRPSEALAIDTALAWEEEWTDRPFTYPDRSIAERLHAFEAREWYELAGIAPREMGAGSVVSPVSYLTIRQRVLFEIAAQSVDPAAAARAREELLRASGLNPTQVRQVESLLAGRAE